MYNTLYDTTILENNIRNRIMKNYEIEANKAKIGYSAEECFWVRQTLADIIIEALPLAKHLNPIMHDSLYNIYLKLSTK